MSGIEALIADLERAGRGSRDLDADVYEALGHLVKRTATINDYGRRGQSWRYWPISPDGSPRWLAMRNLTTSMDDAISLVPESLGWTADHAPGQRPRAYVSGLGNVEIAGGEAATPALALCIAALKARARSAGAR